MKPSIVLQSLAVGVLGVSTAHAATVWNEAQNGDLSNDGLSPTSLSVAPGSNVVMGLTGNSGSGIDRDYFKLTVPPGSTLTAIKLLPNTAVSGGVSFIGIQAGPQLTVSPSGAGQENLIALGHYGNDLIGSDILPEIKKSTTQIPLPSGTYSVWVQDTGGPAEYGFDFMISAPVTTAAAPSLPWWGLMLLASALGSILYLRATRLPRFEPS